MREQQKGSLRRSNMPVVRPSGFFCGSMSAMEASKQYTISLRQPHNVLNSQQQQPDGCSRWRCQQMSVHSHSTPIIAGKSNFWCPPDASEQHTAWFLQGSAECACSRSRQSLAALVYRIPAVAPSSVPAPPAPPPARPTEPHLSHSKQQQSAAISHTSTHSSAAHLQDAAPRQVVTAPLKVVPQAFKSLVYVVLLRPQPALQLSERNLLWQEPLPQVLLGSPATRSARCATAAEPGSTTAGRAAI